MKQARRAVTLGICSFLVLRVSGAVLPGTGSQNLWLLAGALLLCGARLAIIAVDVVRVTLKWQRGLVPAMVFLLLISVLGGRHWHAVAQVAAITAELGSLILLVCIVSRSRHAHQGPLEDRLLEVIELFFPPLLARYVVLELVVARSALRGISRRAVKLVPGAFGYVENSIFPVLPFVVLLCAPADLALVHLIFRIQSILWSTVLGLLDVWALVWTYGLLTMMRLHPHQIVGVRLHLNKGMLAQSIIDLRTIDAIAVLDENATSPRRGPRHGQSDLSLKGAPKLEIVLREEVRVNRWLTGKSEMCSRIVISADEPQALCVAEITIREHICIAPT